MPELQAMGRVLTEATIENVKDCWAAEKGLIKKARKLTGNPAHGGEHMLELY